MMRPPSLPTSDSLFTCLKILIVEKIVIAGLRERQTPLKKLYSLSLFPSMNNHSGGWPAFHLLIRTGLHFMDLAMEVKRPCAFRQCWKVIAFPFARGILGTGRGR